MPQSREPIKRTLYQTVCSILKTSPSTACPVSSLKTSIMWQTEKKAYITPAINPAERDSKKQYTNCLPFTVNWFQLFAISCHIYESLCPTFEIKAIDLMNKWEYCHTQHCSSLTVQTACHCVSCCACTINEIHFQHLVLYEKRTKKSIWCELL